MTPRNYLSYSQLDCYLRDPMEYYRRYILGLQEPANERMKFGSIVHKALAEPRFNWIKELKKEGFTSDYIRVVANALDKIERPAKREVRMLIKHKPIDLLVIIDGLNDNEIIEYKTCASHWTQARVDEHLQFDFYAYAYFLKYGKIPNLTLRSIHTGNGSVRSFTTKRYQKDFKELQTLIESTIDKIKNQVWQKN